MAGEEASRRNNLLPAVGACLPLPPRGSYHVCHPDFPGHLESTHPSSLFGISPPAFHTVWRLCGTFPTLLSSAEIPPQVGNRPHFYDSLIPGVSRLRRVPGSGHLVMWDQPALVFKEIQTFIDS